MIPHVLKGGLALMAIQSTALIPPSLDWSELIKSVCSIVVTIVTFLHFKNNQPPKL